jgi:hypothetical protein
MAYFDKKALTRGLKFPEKQNYNNSRGRLLSVAGR